MRTFVIEEVGGGISIMHINDENSTPEAEIQKWHPSMRELVTFPDGIKSHPVNRKALPTSRDNRKNWKLNGGKVEG